MCAHMYSFNGNGMVSNRVTDCKCVAAMEVLKLDAVVALVIP